MKLAVILALGVASVEVGAGAATKSDEAAPVVRVTHGDRSERPTTNREATPRGAAGRGRTGSKRWLASGTLSTINDAVHVSSRDDGVQVIAHLGPSGYYFLTAPNSPLANMKLTYASGKAGIIEPTGRGKRLRVRLERGMNRVELVTNDQAAGRKVVRYLLLWNGT